MKKLHLHFWKQFLPIIMGVVLCNILAQFWFFRIDFTKEKRYTLSAESLKVIQNLDKEIHITVYLDGEMPAGFKNLRNATKDMLLDIKSYAKGAIYFDFVDPNAQSNPQKREQFLNELYAKGIEPINLSVKTDDGLVQKLIFPSLAVYCDTKTIPVKLLQNRIGLSPEEVLNNSIQNLEYAIISAIKKASEKGLPKVGFLEGHKELSDLQIYDAIKTLSDAFMIGRVNLDAIDFKTLTSLQLLIITKPQQAFSKQDKYKLDQYLMRGGRIIWSIDNVGAELDSLRGYSEQMTFPRQLNIDDMLFRYGVRINYDLIADMNCAQIPLTAGQGGQIQLVPWLFYPLLVPLNSHPVVKNLDAIRSEFVGTIDTLAIKNVKKTVLLSSSPFSRKYDTPKVLSLQMVEDEPDPQDFRSYPKPTMVLLEGLFPSLYKVMPVPDGITESIPTLKQSKATKMVVIADGDIFKNQINGKDNSPFPLGYDRYTSQTYGNKTLLLNLVDYLTDDAGLITLRNRELKIRLLNRAKIRSEKIYWQSINVLLPLFLLTIFGIVHFYWRKNKYAK